MRSDRDKRTDAEREIDDFLSRFDNPSDELSADIDSYLNEQNTEKDVVAQTFSWKNVDLPEKSNDKVSTDNIPDSSDMTSTS